MNARTWRHPVSRSSLSIELRVQQWFCGASQGTVQCLTNVGPVAGFPVVEEQKNRMETSYGIQLLHTTAHRRGSMLVLWDRPYRITDASLSKMGLKVINYCILVLRWSICIRSSRGFVHG